MPIPVPDYEQQFRDRLRAIGARETCPICDAGRWTLHPAYGNQMGRVCGCCGHVLFFSLAPYGWEIDLQRVEGGPFFRPVIVEAARPATPAE